jgi:hypothetical protein
MSDAVSRFSKKFYCLVYSGILSCWKRLRACSFVEIAPTFRWNVLPYIEILRFTSRMERVFFLSESSPNF